MRSRLLDLVTRPAIAGTAAALILRAMTLASRFLLSLLLARMLSPAEMGQYGLLTATLAFALLAVGLEFYSYTLRELVPATPEHRARIIADQMALGSAALLAIGVMVFAAIAAGWFPARLAPWFVVILITEHVSLEATRILIITSRPVRAYIGVFLRGGIWVYVIALLMFAAPSTRTLEMVLALWALGGVLSIAFSAFSLSGLPWCELRGYRPDWSTIREGRWTARPFMLTAAGALVISYVDRFVIDIFVGRDALGIYTFYSTILIGLLSLGGSVSHQFLPKVIAGYSAGVDAYRAAPLLVNAGAGIGNRNHLRPCHGADVVRARTIHLRVGHRGVLCHAAWILPAHVGRCSLLRALCGALGQVSHALQSRFGRGVDAAQRPPGSRRWAASSARRATC